jgi:hypothetical protein
MASKIILDADTGDCPGCVCKILNESRSILMQSDYEAPSVASSFGWSVKTVRRRGCSHDGTDGTIDCKICGVTASQFIKSAQDYIEANDGKSVDDPGYFE